MLVRPEADADHDRVRAINLAAFESSEEADIVDRLRVQADPVISLVAVDGGVIVGHIIFTPVTLDGSPGPLLMGLGPMAVATAHQRRGIGGGLVEAGLEQCRQRDAAAVIVLGHPTYYPRFGFVPASELGLKCEFDVPDEVFMALELMPGSGGIRPGVISYHPAFGGD